MIGERNRLIEIWRNTGAVDEANDPVPDPWEFVKRKWAKIKGETGMGSIRSAAAAGGVNTPLDRYSFRVNYDKGIDIGMQIRDPEGARYNILSVRHDLADREWTDIVGETGGANG